MAARWGTGEEMLKACNAEIFTSMNLDETEILQGSFSGSCLEYHNLNNGAALEALHDCLDPSILSIFEDNPTGEVKSNIDEESEATLLTALTEILDNVDDDNLSPFDTLPDSDLFSGQKGQEHSPMRKILSRSPLEKESLVYARQFPGKSLPRVQNRAFLQNSEGEDEDCDATPMAIDLPLLDGFEWCLPVSLEQDGDSTSVTLGDLVKHMHPYCMTLCMEGEEGREHLLPEGGIVLEVVDQGEHGEPILAIPDLRLPLSCPSENSVESEQRVPEKNMDEPEAKTEKASASESPVEEKVVIEKVVVKLPRSESFDKSHSKQKKKQERPEPSSVEQRVLRSSSAGVKEMLQKKQQEEQKKKTVTLSTSCSSQPGKPKSEHLLMTPEPQVETENIMTSQAGVEIIESKPEDKPVPRVLPLVKSDEAETPSNQECAVCPNTETKPKPLSLQQYRLLRQQKKPDLVNKTEDNSTKWPTLPEAPKELPPIPCLPAPNSRDPRRTSSTPVKKDLAPEIMPAWHPRGPAAPPTPEALLVPPASMITSSKKPVSSKLSAESSPQAVQPSPSASSQKLPTETSSSAVLSASPKKLPSETSPLAALSSSPNTPPASTSVPQNTIQTEIPQKALGRAISLPLSTSSKGSHGLHTPSHKECLNRNPSAAHVVEERSRKTESSATIEVESAAIPVKRETEHVVMALVPDQAKNSPNPKKQTTLSQPHVAPIAAQPFFSAQVKARVVELAEQMRMASSEIPKPKNCTVELIQSFTSEIGIEASDLTSLLEQFEESQSKEEQSVPEVCGRAAAVGNSSFEQQVERKALEKTRSHDLGSTAGLTPPATPPHQMWKPIAPVALLGKNRKSEVPKQTPNKVIQIEARPLPSNKLRSKPQTTTTTTGQIQPFSLDHDYCLPPKEAHQNEVGNRWNVKQQPSIIIKSIELPSNKAAQHSVPKTPFTSSVTEKKLDHCQPSVDRRCGERDALKSSVLATPDASPDRPECESTLLDETNGSQMKSLSYSESSSRQCQQKRGRSRRRYRAPSSSSSESSSASSSTSRSPPRKRYRSRHSSSRSSSPSRSRSRSSSRSYSPPRRRRYSYSSSRSGSWSHSRSRSRSHSSDSHGRQHWKSCRSPNPRSAYSYSQSQTEDSRRRKEKAIEERRIVYVGRIRGNMTRKELKERFSYFGEIEECTVHFRENGDNYGFVTYYNTNDAFNAIEKGSRLREPNELSFDLCFGGRRQFCKANYADLDSTREYEPVSTKGKFNALDFDTLLKQAQKNQKR